MRKLMATICITALLTSNLVGCAREQRKITQEDVQIAVAQSMGKKACYDNLPKPDYTGMDAKDKLLAKSIEALDHANARLSGKSIDPCADAGGTNVYDAEIVGMQEATKQIESWHKLAGDITTKGLLAWVGGKAIDNMGGGVHVENSGYQSQTGLSDVLNKTTTTSTYRDVLSGTGAQGSADLQYNPQPLGTFGGM